MWPKWIKKVYLEMIGFVGNNLSPNFYFWTLTFLAVTFNDTLNKEDAMSTEFFLTELTSVNATFEDKENNTGKTFIFANKNTRYLCRLNLIK